MIDLIKGLSPLSIDFAVSLPHSLLATISLMCASSEFEGLGEWLRETLARLPADLCEELCVLIGFPGHHQRFTSELSARLPDGAASMEFDELIAHLRAIPGVHYQLIALQALARGTSLSPNPNRLLDLLDRPAEWASYLAEIESKVDPDTVATFVRDGTELKSRLLTALERFWQDAYAQEFRATRPLMERSMIRHRTVWHGSGFHETFASTTGRLVPEPISDLLPSITTVTFIPSCYVGPYVAFMHYADQLILFFNCRSTPSTVTAEGGASLYPPLKALADETRLQILTLLQGRELYAQEIVELLEISQPAVSRHLNLMAAAGVLQIRREGNAKYYAVNSETMLRLADALRTFV
jgi:DNA-binding transcriptional ArsR family regulator